MEISVRRAEQADLEFVSRYGYTKPESVGLKIERGEVIVVEVDTGLGGYLVLEFLWSVHPYIAMILVDEAQRGRGLGRAMLEYLESELRRGGYTALFSSSQVDEAEAQAWHRHMGFEECGMITGLNEGGVGEVFFRKPL